MRPVYTLGLLLLCITRVQAGQQILAWDYDMQQYPDVRFSLAVVSMQQGRPVQVEQFIDPFPTTQCNQYPDPSPSPDPRLRVCGQVCLGPGTYSLTVFATRASERSGPSNVVDLDVTSTTPCPGDTPIKPPPPPKKPPVVPILPPPVTPPPATASLTGMINLQCVSWKITGPCVCNPLTPCVSVEYWEPGWVIETVKKPGTTIVPVLGTLLSTVLQAVHVLPFGGGGAANASGSGQTNLQYNEVHVYKFPQLFGGPCTGCAPSPTAPFTLNYASETDPVWRVATAIQTPLDLVRQLGVWQKLYPRQGRAIHGSEVVGSGIAAARGLDIAFNPVGEPPNLDHHVVLQPSLGTSSCCQIGSPRVTPCFQVGTPPSLWESWTLSPTGSYVWIFWTKKSCCVNPAQATCGITVLGGQGGNACVIPSTPTP